MKQALVVLLAICALTAAMVPRQVRSPVDPKNSTTEIRYCSSDTPCAWSFYTSNKVIQQEVDNTYCICKPNATCRRNENNKDANAYVHVCMENGS